LLQYIITNITFQAGLYYLKTILLFITPFFTYGEYSYVTPPAFPVFPYKHGGRKHDRDDGNDGGETITVRTGLGISPIPPTPTHQDNNI
jgi:hypothetical protein